MTKMASHESEGSVKSPVTDKVNITSESKTDEEESSTASPLVDRHNEPSDATADAKENRTLNSTDDCTNIQTKDSDNTKSEKKDDLMPLVENEQDDSKTDEKQGTQNPASPTDPQNADEEKEVKSEDSKDSSTKGGPVLKRKRKTLSNPAMESPVEENGTRSERKKLKTGYDRFCWRCHKEKVNTYCTACPRSWHRKCIGGMPSSLEKWICGECASILKAENAETRSIAMAQLSIDQLCMLLKHVVERLRDYPSSEPFCKPVDLIEVPNYLDYVIKPMDLSLLESNVRSKLYGSTDAFMADARWIQHNCIVFNTCGGVYADTKLTNAAKYLVKVARQEVSEIEACPDCYAHCRNLSRPQPSWFIEPCRRPHPLVWAKLKGFPFWPAKAMPRVNSQGYVDVRFFGEHDRSWLPPKDLFLYSEEPPSPSPRKRKTDMDECMREITRHCRKLALMFGQFKFAPPKIQYDPNDPMQIQLMLPNYNPLESNNPLSNPEFSTPQKKKTPQKKRSFLKGKSKSDELTDNSKIDTDSKGDAREEATSPKVQKLDTDVKDTSNAQTNLDDSHNKLNKKADQESVKSTPQEVAQQQNKTAKGVKSRNARTSTSRLNVTLTDNNAENNSASPNISNSDKNNSQRAKNDVKSSAKNLPKTATPISESSDTARVQKRSLLKNIINPKLALSQMDNSKAVTKSTRKVLKPKTRIVDKLNAEKELRTASASKENENEKLSSPSKVISLLKNNKESSNVQKSLPEIDITLSPSTASNASVIHTIPSASTNPIVPTADKSVFFLVMNGKAAEPTVASAIDYQGDKDTQQGGPTKFPTTKEGQYNSPRKARKTFPGRSPNSQNVQRPLSDAGAIIQVSPVRQETSSTYELPPPEAGPISARLHHDAHDLARRMGHLMEETYKAAAQDNVNGENGTADSYQATIFFLRMQIEHMKWQHQQQLAELKHNADRTLREMRASLEADRLRSIEEVRKEVEEEKIRCIEETKKKQWCAKCGQEAMFYCCWNTAYCNYPCQESHWPTHMRTCSQQPAYTIVSVANSNPQQSNNIVTHDSTNKTYPLSPGKLRISSSISSASSLRNKTSQDTL